MRMGGQEGTAALRWCNRVSEIGNKKENDYVVVAAVTHLHCCNVINKSSIGVLFGREARGLVPRSKIHSSSAGVGLHFDVIVDCLRLSLLQARCHDAHHAEGAVSAARCACENERLAVRDEVQVGAQPMVHDGNGAHLEESCENKRTTTEKRPSHAMECKRVYFWTSRYSWSRN